VNKANVEKEAKNLRTKKILFGDVYIQHIHIVPVTTAIIIVIIELVR
jgi:hypothetical protein